MTANIKVPRSRLLLRTLDLLKNRPRELTLEQIAKETGLTLAWLSYISTKREVSSAVDRIEVLYEYLTQSKLSIL